MTRKRRNGKAKRAPAPRLPAELVEYIVGFLDPSERPRCLARLSRVSRHFRKTTQWLLYERICIRFEDVEEHRGANWPYEGKKREKWDSSPLWRLGASSVKCLATLRDSFSLAEMWLSLPVRIFTPSGHAPSSRYHELELPEEMPNLQVLDWRSSLSFDADTSTMSDYGEEHAARRSGFPPAGLHHLSLANFSGLYSSPPAAITHLSLHHQLSSPDFVQLCQYVARSLVHLTLDFYCDAPLPKADELALGPTDAPLSSLTQLKTMTVVLRRYSTRQDTPQPDYPHGSFKADFRRLCALIGTLPKTNPVVPTLRLPPIFPIKRRQEDRIFWRTTLQVWEEQGRFPRRLDWSAV
ncbi:hypothetical protein NBRC10513_005698 [Rhodotorula toruloides]